MTRNEVGKRLEHLQGVGFAHNLVAEGYLLGAPIRQHVTNFRAGFVKAVPDPSKIELSETADFRVWYFSGDGQRQRDVTDMSDQVFVAFMRTEPAHLITFD